VSIDGIYAGIATASSSGAEITIEIELATFGKLEVALRYPEDELVEPLFGIGSQWGHRHPPLPRPRRNLHHLGVVDLGLR